MHLHFCNMSKLKLDFHALQFRNPYYCLLIQAVLVFFSVWIFQIHNLKIVLLQAHACTSLIVLICISFSIEIQYISLTYHFAFSNTHYNLQCIFLECIHWQFYSDCYNFENLWYLHRKTTSDSFWISLLWTMICNEVKIDHINIFTVPIYISIYTLICEIKEKPWHFQGEKQRLFLDPLKKKQKKNLLLKEINEVKYLSMMCRI